MSTELTHQPPTAEPPTAEPSSRAFNAGLIVLAVVPLAFVHFVVLGLRMSGLAWLTSLVVVAPLILFEPLDPRAVRRLLPYLLFLAYAIVTLLWTPDIVEALLTLVQLIAFACIYFLGWRIRRLWRFVATLPAAALYLIGTAGVLAIVTLGGRRTIGGAEMSLRPTAMGLVVLFILFGISTRSWRLLTLVGATTFAIALFTGSRMAAATLIVVLLTHPSLTSNRPKWLTLVSVLLLGLLALSNTTAFRERFFFSQDATLKDAITLSDNLNTAGRRELWPDLASSCSETATLGQGLGAATQLSLRFTDDVLEHPHNEFLRVYCDSGIIGTTLFWGFFLAAGLRNYRAVRAGRDTYLHTGALQCIGVLLVLSITDNPLVYTALFMAPIALVLGLADRESSLPGTRPQARGAGQALSPARAGVAP